MLTLARKFKILFFLILFVNLILGLWYLLHGDIHFHTDIARDFLLLNELKEKGLVLIGPRSSIPGLYHGPLWTYLNYPIFLLGQGNPLVVGWFWALMWLVFLGASFWVAKSLFNKQAAYCYTLLLSVFMIRHANETFHPHGALFLSPLFFYTFIKYWQTKRARYLILHLFLAGLMIQFQMAIGVPLLILSTIFVLYQVVKNRLFHHLFSFLVLAIPLSTFFLFDLRHGFTQFKTIELFLGGTESGGFNFLKLFTNRMAFLASDGIYLFYGYNLVNQLVIAPFVILLLIQIKRGIFTKQYSAFLYFFFGYFLLSVANKGVVLHPHFFALAPIVFLIFSSLNTIRVKEIFWVFFGGVYFSHLASGLNYVAGASDFIGKAETSWQFQHAVAKDVYSDSKKDFGYFIYSPDLYGYSTKYAFIYANDKFGTHGASFQKLPDTYLIYTKIAQDTPWLAWGTNSGFWGTPLYWRINKVRINKDAEYGKQYANGFRWEKYTLEATESAILADRDFDNGIIFR